jgi:hypothetical protein
MVFVFNVLISFTSSNTIDPSAARADMPERKAFRLALATYFK